MSNLAPSLIVEENPAVRPAKSRIRHLRHLRALKFLVVPALLAGVWVAVTQTGTVAEIYLPSPPALWESAKQLAPEFGRALGISLQMVFGGLLIGGVSGIGVGLLFGYSRHARELLEFTLDGVRPVPLFALIPLFILWFGIGKAPQIALVALGVFLILTIETIEAIRNVPHIYVRAALTAGASRLHIYRTVVLPAITPHLIAGVRFAAASAWGLDVAAEFSGSQDGLGYIMITREQFLDTAGVVLVVLIFSVMAIALDQIIRWGARHVTRWSRPAAGGGLVTQLLGGGRG
jgi:ABC-type nitrate/sulfonate/bicarbonate transport system permease component